MAVNGWRVADSDMHVMEPADLWQRYMDPAWAHAAPIGLSEMVRDMRVRVKNHTMLRMGRENGVRLYLALAGGFLGNPREVLAMALHQLDRARSLGIFARRARAPRRAAHGGPQGELPDAHVPRLRYQPAAVR